MNLLLIILVKSFLVDSTRDMGLVSFRLWLQTIFLGISVIMVCFQELGMVVESVMELKMLQSGS